MKDRLLQQTKREYGSNQRLAALAVEAVFFIGILPLALLLLGGLLDRWLGWPKLVLPPISAIVGALSSRPAGDSGSGRFMSSSPWAGARPCP